MSRKIPEDLFKVWTATKEEVIKANIQAENDNAFFNKSVLDSILGENPSN